MLFRILLVSVVLMAAVYYVSLRVSPQDRDHYAALMEESAQLRTARALEKEPAWQKRQNVNKDIWTEQESHHFVLQSESSTLQIAQKKDSLEASETLHAISCMLPNGWTLDADAGLYNYPSQQFIAKDNCKLRQADNLIEGTRLHLDFAEETVHYEHPRGYIASENLHFFADTLWWEKGADLLHLEKDVIILQKEQFKILAQEATILLKDFHPTQAILEGKVRLVSSRIQGKESYAIADRLIFNPQDHTLLFSADNRVLFWQDGLSLSASEVKIRQDETVEGRGDVHFTFDLDEQGRIDAFFKQYL